MSRRTGQDGYIEASGKWWVVRWWMDMEGQEARKHMRVSMANYYRAHRVRNLSGQSIWDIYVPPSRGHGSDRYDFRTGHAERCGLCQDRRSQWRGPAELAAL